MQPQRQDGLATSVPMGIGPVARVAPLVVVALVVAAFIGGYTSSRSSPTPRPNPAAAATPRGTAKPAATALVPLAGRTLYFARFEDFPSDAFDSLIAYYRTKYGVTAKALPLAAIDPAAWDGKRRQVVAESAIASIKALHADVAADRGAVVIGLISADLYIRERTDWAWAFGLRSDGRFAVVSTARMSWPGGAAGKAEMPVRLRKMVSRDIGFLYFGLAPNNDRRSVLYRDVLGVDDLDRMGEDF